MRRDTIALYGLPSHVEFCSVCVMSNQRPRNVFVEGVCGGCRFAEKKRQIDWEGERESQLLELLDLHRDGDGDYDVIVPCSGGKDGGFTAHQLQEKYGMRVLAVSWAPLRFTDIGRRNLDSFIGAGFNHILGTPDPRVTSRLTRESFLRLGDPFQPFIYGQTNFPVRIAKAFGATLIMYGENGEVEYGGDDTEADSSKKDGRNKDKHYFSGLSLDSWLDLGFTQRDLELFRVDPNFQVDQRFFGYYKRWDPQENFYYAAEHLGFEPNETRSEGTYSRYASLDDRFDGFHYYLSFIKFGIGRATSDAAHEIRDGKISRKDGVELVREYDGEFPQKYFNEFLSYTNLSESDFWQSVNDWRSDHLWKNEQGEWSLKWKVWG